MKNEAIHNKDYSVVKTLRAGQLLTRSSSFCNIRKRLVRKFLIVSNMNNMPVLIF